MGDRGRPRPADRSVRHSCELTVRDDAIFGTSVAANAAL
jgi:hypothetical protein